MHGEGQGNKERHKVRKELFGKKKPEKKDLTKVIQEAMIDDDEDGEIDMIEWDSGDSKEELEGKKGMPDEEPTLPKGPNEERRGKHRRVLPNGMERRG